MIKIDSKVLEKMKIMRISEKRSIKEIASLLGIVIDFLKGSK